MFGVPRLEGHPEAELLRVRAKLVARSVARIGVDAVNVGRFDLAAGLAFVETLGLEAKVPWVSANLRRKGGGRPFPGYRLVPWGNGKAAVFGLLPPSPTVDAALGIDVGDPETAAAALLRELPPVNAVVCLSTLGLAAELELARKVPGLTAIVGGGSGELLVDPALVGSTVILHAADKGRFLGVLDLGAGKAAGAGASPGRAHRLVALDASKTDDAEIASWVQGFKATEASARGAPRPPPAGVGPSR